MGYEVYGPPEAGLCGRFCLRDAATGKCFRDAHGNLITFPDAATANEAIPIPTKQAKEAAAIVEPLKTEKAGK